MCSRGINMRIKVAFKALHADCRRDNPINNWILKLLFFTSKVGCHGNQSQIWSVPADLNHRLLRTYMWATLYPAVWQIEVYEYKRCHSTASIFRVSIFKKLIFVVEVVGGLGTSQTSKQSLCSFGRAVWRNCFSLNEFLDNSWLSLRSWK